MSLPLRHPSWGGAWPLPVSAPWVALDLGTCCPRKERGDPTGDGHTGRSPGPAASTAAGGGRRVLPQGRRGTAESTSAVAGAAPAPAPRPPAFRSSRSLRSHPCLLHSLCPSDPSRTLSPNQVAHSAVPCDPAPSVRRAPVPSQTPTLSPGPGCLPSPSQSHPRCGEDTGRAGSHRQTQVTLSLRPAAVAGETPARLP